MTTHDIAVIGGGLAGLVAARYAARAGRRVVLLEQSGRLGGRGHSISQGEATLNLGPHALYQGGPAEAVLRELGVSFRGKSPGVGTFAEENGQLHPLPADALSLLSSRLLSIREKWSLLRALAAAMRGDLSSWIGRPLSEWLDENTRPGTVRALLATLFRLSTYCEEPRQCAGAALTQLRLAFRNNVLYLDGGWQSLADGLSAQLRAEGVEVLLHAKVEALCGEDRAEGVQLSDGREISARAVVVAGTPKQALSVLRGKAQQELETKLAGAVPVRAACLDLVLSSLPKPGHKAAFGLSRPLYLSLHSEAAQIAPQGIAVLHAAKYLGAEEPGASAEFELEGLLDLAQPGWRDRVVARRFLPEMQVHGWRCLASQGGLAGRPGGVLSSCAGVYLAGDWVGSEGMLLDAALASAKGAALRAVEGSAWKS
jgi:phytoene dehydrogenase-like protein